MDEKVGQEIVDRINQQASHRAEIERKLARLEVAEGPPPRGSRRHRR